MTKFLQIILGFLFVPAFSFAQGGTISGTISDTSINAKTAYASVSILQQSDSILVTHTRSGQNGVFNLKNLDAGDYILLVTYPKYGDYVDRISLKQNENLDLGAIYITQKAKLLDEVFIRQSPIRIKGDTTEYTADSFKVKANASVEDLLKVLPGIQVDKDGKIIAQGKQIQKVLVDGDEFFSDDPTVATKNLRADAIDKVQVYEKKSDQAAFTGIDDGQTTKTLDLKLKENARKGYFGKVSVAGLDKYYNATAMINAFKAKRKFSAFAIASSTSETGLNFGDAQSLGFDDGGSISFEGGGVMITRMGSGSGDLGSGNNFGQGLPESVKAGIHFSNKWNNDKLNAGGNYLFNNLATRSGGNTFSQNTLLDSVYFTRESGSTHTNRMQHSLNGQTEIQIDSSSTLKITARGNVGTNDSRSENMSEALSEEKQKVNSSKRNTTSNGDLANINTNAIWRKKFKKTGRTISLNLNQQYNESKTNGLLLNTSEFFDVDGTLIRTENTDQNKVNSSEASVLTARVAYTEPLSKKSFIELNYSLNHSSNDQKKLSYDKDGNGKYSVLLDSLSSDFKYLYTTNSGGINYRFNEKKYSFSVGGNIENTAFNQEDRFKDNSRKYSYNNFYPQSYFSYKFNSFSNIRINYNGRTTQPTINQLQPLLNNEDPLNIVIGNPNLKQSFTNTVSLNYSSFQMINERSIFLGANYNSTEDQISNSYVIDSLGKRVNQYINVDGNYSVSTYGGFNMKIPKTNLGIDFSPSLYLSKSTNYINKIRNTNNNLTFSPTIRITNRKPDVYELYFSATPGYTRSKSSISKAASTNYWTYSFSVEGNVVLPGKIEIGSDVDFQFREKLDALDNQNNVILWNAYLEKKFLKNDVLTLRASVNDILDQNKGYSRTVQPDATVERTYLTFQRYGLITLTYNFNTSGAKPAPSRGRVIRF